ncbi:MAG: C25 family cysteine peptidase [bacterium]
MISLCLALLLIGGSSVKEIGTKGLEIIYTVDEQTQRQPGFTPLETQSLTGYTDGVRLNKTGEPDLQSILYRIGLPQGSDFDITITKGREELYKDIDIAPVIIPGIEEPSRQKAEPILSDVYKENVFFPENLIEISQPGYFRDIYTVNVRVNPVQYNPITRELRVIKSFTIHVKYKGSPKNKAIIDHGFEDIYQRTIINFDQCKNWRREPLQIIDNPFETGIWYKIEVDEEGLFRIDHEVLEAANIDPAQFDPQTMKIYTAAFELLPRDVQSVFNDSLVEVPVYVTGEDDHSFDSQDYLLFYGHAANHYYCDTAINWFENGYAINNVYWFTFGGDYGQRMEAIDAAWSGSTPDTLVDEILHFEQDVSNPTRSGTNWYWLNVSPGAGAVGSGSINMQHVHAVGSAEIKLGLFTLNYSSWIYQIDINGNVWLHDTLGLTVRDHLPPHYLYGAGPLSGDSSVLILTISRHSGTAGDLTAYFNGVDLQYQRLTIMDEPFHGLFTSAQDYSVECSNTGSDPVLVDITDNRKPKILSGYTLNNNRLQLSGTVDSIQLLYFSRVAFAKPVIFHDCNPGNLKTASTGCEYLIITHPDFYNAIMPLADYRRHEYVTKIVRVDEIYNDFSYGKFDPLAIKHFLYHTTNNWTTVPTYVLLVGDATYDYKNNLGKENPPNYIPMYERGSTLSGNAGIPPASNVIYEGEYVNFDNAGEAMILGRITVRNNGEVRDFIEKLTTYETQNIDGMWNKRIILAGDDEYSTIWEGPGMHCGACENMITYVPDSFYDFAKVYMVSYEPIPPPAGEKVSARKAFIRELNKGAYFGIYFGHGNMHDLAHEGLFYDRNIPEVRNGRRNFLYYFGSCTVGRFDDSDYECIAEQFVRGKDGAIGTLAATAGTNSGSNTTIGQRLTSLITDPDTNLTMGECCFAARDGFWYSHYLLIGDPATRMRKPLAQITMSAQPESLRPVDKLTVITDEQRFYLKSFVRDNTTIEIFNEATADKISYRVYRMVQGPNSWVPFEYFIDGKEIYHGYWDNDTAILIAPRIATFTRPMIKLSSYINNETGFHDSTLIFGTAAPSTDDVGPGVTLYDGAKPLANDDWVEKEFTLTGRVSDSSGINLLNSVHDTRGFYLYINQDTENKIDLRDYFMYNRNSYTTGEFNVDLVLPEAVDTLTIYVSDNYYNQTVETIILNAELYGRIAIDNFLIYPNPIQNNTGAWFTFTVSNSGLVDIKIFTIAGRLIKTISDRPIQAGYNQIFWDGHDEYSDEISNGVYLVKALVRNQDSRDEAVEKFIIAR